MRLGLSSSSKPQNLANMLSPPEQPIHRNCRWYLRDASRSTKPLLSSRTLLDFLEKTSAGGVLANLLAIVNIR